MTLLRYGVEVGRSYHHPKVCFSPQFQSQPQKRTKTDIIIVMLLDTFRISIEELMRYLSDRRPHISGALETFHINNTQAHAMPPLSSTSVEDLFALPDAPLASLTPEQLVRFGQIVDTALFKSYLIVRPGLLAPLCRSGNWCEVSEVEKELRAREVSLGRPL